MLSYLTVGVARDQSRLKHQNRLHHPVSSYIVENVVQSLQHKRTPRDAPALAPAPSPATNEPESSAQGANPRRSNNTLGNNTAEGAANNLNPAVTISVADLQAIHRELRTWKKLLSGTPVAAANSNPSQIISAHRNALILKAKPLTNTGEKIIRS